MSLNFLIKMSFQLVRIDIYADVEAMYDQLYFGVGNFYSLFSGLLSVSIGFCSTTYVWMSKLSASISQ